MGASILQKTLQRPSVRVFPSEYNLSWTLLWHDTGLV